MKTAEQVTFGGGGLDRAAHIRENPKARAAAWGHPKAGVVLVWRGKILMQGDGLDILALMRPDHPLIADGPGGSVQRPVFLGLVPGDEPRFAWDISAWVPDDLDLDTLGLFLDPSLQRHPQLDPDLSFAELRRVMSRLGPLDAVMAATAKAILGWHFTHQFCAKCGQPSISAEAGWQRSCPSCKAAHFPRTDPVVIMLITHGDAVLMGRSPGWPEGMYSLLAGFVEPGETLEAAVRREVEEEAGVKVGAVSYLASQPWPFPASLMFGCRGEALTRDIEIDPIEIEDALWVNRNDMMQVFAGEHPSIKPARRGAIAHFLLHNWLADTLD
jgi:NAD+ diphosphatase